MPKAFPDAARVDRRTVVLSGAALAGTAALPSAFAHASAAGLAPAADLHAAANKFLSSLEPAQRQAASFAWNGPEWRGWNYFGSSDFIKPGLRLEQMGAQQKAAAWEILATVLSPGGLEKAKNVMTLQDVLAALGNGAGKRSSERFSFAVFGMPAETGTWGFRFEGHHLSQSIAVRDGRIVCRHAIVVLRHCPTASAPENMPASSRSRPRRRWRAGCTATWRHACRPRRDNRSRRCATSSPMRAASARTRRRSVSPPPSCRRRNATSSGSSWTPTPWSTCRRLWPRRRRRASLRRSRGRAFRVVRPQHGGESLRLPADRR